MAMSAFLQSFLKCLKLPFGFEHRRIRPQSARSSACISWFIVYSSMCIIITGYSGREGAPAETRKCCRCVVFPTSLPRCLSRKGMWIYVYSAFIVALNTQSVLYDLPILNKLCCDFIPVLKYSLSKYPCWITHTASLFKHWMTRKWV